MADDDDLNIHTVTIHSLHLCFNLKIIINKINKIINNIARINIQVILKNFLIITISFIKISFK